MNLHPTEVEMGLRQSRRPTQGDKKRLLSSNRSTRKRRHPLSSPTPNDKCRTYGARILFGIDSPALPGWADVLAIGPTGLASLPIAGVISLSSCRRQFGRSG